MPKNEKIIYFDCRFGVSGDMFLGALVDAGVPFDLLDSTIRSLGIHHLELTQKEVVRHGIRATKIDVLLPHEHAHRHLADILAIIDQAQMSPRARKIASDIFSRLAQAEGKVHGKPPEEVHFHEVGAADSIADIICIATGIDYINPDSIVCSPVTTGTGTIEIAHGSCSVPAPATAELLRGVPIRGGDAPFELTTPTGAAAVVVLSQAFGPCPDMILDRMGIGAGTREMESHANVFRIFVGTAEREDKNCDSDEQLWMVETNLDDMSGESLAYLIQKLWEAAPRDIFTTPIQMKKQRPGVLVTVLVEKSQVDAVKNVFFHDSTTWGVRHYPIGRTQLPRRVESVATPWGPVAGKSAVLDDGTVKFKPEYEELARIARAEHLPLEYVQKVTANLFAASNRVGE
ncbi:MAG: nickel pincer cofactor biosynthesis protein LarC [Thermoguttaceae bacterium]|nr:nickel pincer cofactor biosynthesis protein LarC [Thermoguttaceae bacterium]